MLLLIPLILLLIVTLFYMVTKEGLEEKKDLKNEYLDKKAIHVDLDKNSVEIPNRVSGIVSEDLELGGSLNILNENKIEIGKGTKNKGPASGTVQYKGGFLNIIGAGKDGEKNKVKLWDDVEVGSLLHVGDQLSVSGPLKVDKNIELGPADKRTDAGKIQYGDMLEITGAGKGSDPRKIKLSDNVEITGTLNTANQSVTDQNITGTQTVKNQTISGAQKILAGQDVTGASSYKGKVNINPNGTDNTPDLSIGDSKVGFAKGDNKVKFMAKGEVGGFDSEFGGGSLYLNQSKPLELGRGMSKQVDAGTIAYKRHSVNNGFQDSLDIVGAGDTGTNRKVRMWDDVEVIGGLKVRGPVEMPGLKQGAQFEVGNRIEFAKGTKKEQNAGTIQYKTHGYGKSLDIVGASPENKTSWNTDREIELWDNVRVHNRLRVSGNMDVDGPTTTVKDLNVTGNLTLGKGNNKWIIKARDVDGNTWLEFLHQDVNKQNQFQENAGHIIMAQDGNIWLPRAGGGRGWVADNIGAAASTGNNNSLKSRQEGYWTIYSDARGDKLLYGQNKEFYVLGRSGWRQLADGR